jgi:hypothetical protein
MADGTKAGGDAPRTLFSLGRSKRKGRGAETSPLEDYPPRHAEDPATDDETSPLEAIEHTDIEAAHAELLRDDAEGTSDLDIADLDSIVDDADEHACPSCSEPLVSGAMFCGECGTRVTTAEDSEPAAVLLDDEVPGEPLPPEPEGAFEVAEPVTGSFEDEELLDADDLAEDDGAHLEEQAVFGAFIAADDLAETDTEAEVEAGAELAESDVVAEDAPETDVVAEDDADSDVDVEAEDDADVVAEDDSDVLADAEDETDADAALEDDAEAGVDGEPESELVDDETDADAGVVVAEGAETDVVDDSVEAELADEESDAVAPVVPIAAATTAAAADGSRGGSKKGVWIGVAAAAAAVVLIIGVVAMGSGGKSETEKDDQAASGTQKSTTTTAASSTTASPTSTVAPSTTDTSAPPTTDTSVVPSTNTSAVPQTPSTPTPPVVPTTTAQKPAVVTVECPPTLAPGGSYQIRINNSGGSTSFLVTWSALKTGVTVSPTTGNVGPNSTAIVTVNVANGTPGSASRVTIKWSGGSTSCNLLVQ